MNNNTPLTEFHVTWEITLSAATPVEAAKIALDVQRDKDSIATVFRVEEVNSLLTYKVGLLGGELEASLEQPGEVGTTNFIEPVFGLSEVEPFIPGITPARQVVDWVWVQYGVELTSTELLRAMDLMRVEALTPAAAGAGVIGERQVKVARKPFGIDVRVDLHYDIPADTLPEFATETGVEKLIEDAISDYNKPLKLESFGKAGILGMEPVEVSLVNVLSS